MYNPYTRHPPFHVVLTPTGASLYHYLEAAWQDGRAPFDPKELMKQEDLRNANPNEVRAWAVWHTLTPRPYLACGWQCHSKCVRTDTCHPNMHIATCYLSTAAYRISGSRVIQSALILPYACRTGPDRDHGQPGRAACAAVHGGTRLVQDPQDPARRERKAEGWGSWYRAGETAHIAELLSTFTGD